MFKDKYEAGLAFERIVHFFAQYASRPSDHEGAFALDARWTIEEGYLPTILEIKRWDIGGTMRIELKCGIYDLVVGAERGQWQYFCREAMNPANPPLVPHHTVFDSMDLLKSALAEDIKMYLDGSYKQSLVRPRSFISA